MLTERSLQVYKLGGKRAVRGRQPRGRKSRRDRKLRTAPPSLLTGAEHLLLLDKERETVPRGRRSVRVRACAVYRTVVLVIVTCSSTLPPPPPTTHF